MKLREGKITNLPLIIVTIITLLFIFIELNSKLRVPTPHFKEKLKAASSTLESFKIIKQEVHRLNIPIDRINDPNETGLIGLQYSPITTERGDLNAKLTATNPNFAALMIDFLKKARVRENDVIAVSFSGSFPGLNIAIMSAIKVLNLKPIIITSVGASMWGANYPELTYLDMERIIYDAGLIDFKSIAASIGGEDDIGRGLSPEGRQMIRDAITRNNIPMLTNADLNESMHMRLELFKKTDKPKVFIDVGGGSAALAGTEILTGYIAPNEIKFGNSLVAEFSKMGVSVINLLDINRLAERYHLPAAPIPLPDVGEGPLYHEMKYSIHQAIIFTIILLIILFFVLKFDTEYYIKLFLKVNKENQDKRRQ